MIRTCVQLTVTESGGYTIKCRNVNPKLLPFLRKYKLRAPRLPRGNVTIPAGCFCKKKKHERQLLKENEKKRTNYTQHTNNLILPLLSDFLRLRLM